jgi:hypothetical protein
MMGMSRMEMDVLLNVWYKRITVVWMGQIRVRVFVVIINNYNLE